jgi:hypothetical protein
MFDTIYRHLTSLPTPNTSSLFIHDYFVVFDANITSRLIKRMAISKEGITYVGKETRDMLAMSTALTLMSIVPSTNCMSIVKLYYFLYFRKV